MSKQVEFTGEIVIKDWRVVACYEHPDVFHLSVYQKQERSEMINRESISFGMQMTKSQFTDLRNLLKAVDLAEQVII